MSFAFPTDIAALQERSESETSHDLMFNGLRASLCEDAVRMTSHLCSIGSADGHGAGDEGQD